MELTATVINKTNISLAWIGVQGAEVCIYVCVYVCMYVCMLLAS